MDKPKKQNTKSDTIDYSDVKFDLHPDDSSNWIDRSNYFDDDKADR